MPDLHQNPRNSKPIKSGFHKQQKSRASTIRNTTNDEGQQFSEGQPLGQGGTRPRSSGKDHVLRRRGKYDQREGQGKQTGGEGEGDHMGSGPRDINVNSNVSGRYCTNNVQKRNSVKRTKSQHSTKFKIVHGKRKSVIDSPTRRLNKRLLHELHLSHKSNELYLQEINKLQNGNLQDIYQLQRENEILSRGHVELTQKIETWKMRCSKLKDKNVHFVKLQAMKKENHALKEDLEVCKSVICRLNKELMSCQERLGILEEGENDSEEVMNNEKFAGNRRVETMINPSTRIFPLLLAYDEVIKEKNETIIRHENTLRHFKTQCKEIISENQNLHKVVSEKQEKGTVSIEEWQFLHANALVVLEENDVLHEKIDLLKKKEDIMMRKHEEKVHKIKTKNSTLEEERAILKEALSKSENQCKNFIEQQSRLTEILEKRIPLDQHEASVHECKVLFEELKVNYNSERAVLMGKLELAEREKDRLCREIAELEATNGRLHASVSSCEETLISNTQQFKEVYRTMLDATKARDAAIIAMEETRRLSQQLIEDRENNDHLLHEQRSLNENLIQLRERQTGLVYQLQQKIREMYDIHSREVEKYFMKIQELEKAKELLCLDQHQKVGYLENIIEEKSHRIDHLETEKRQLELDLETVWKTTTSTMKEIANNR